MNGGNMTDFTEEQIREAYDRLDSRNKGWTPTYSELIAELTRPPQQFREGQVLHHSYLEDDQPTGEYVAIDGVDLDCYGPSWRKLTQSEVGPDWYPKEAVEVLKETMMRIIETESRTEISGKDPERMKLQLEDIQKILRFSLAAFDKATNRNQFEDYVRPGEE